ncbi:MAG: L-2-hydroxyglutarate oxidase, partial [Bacteroidota bacterium]
MKKFDVVIVGGGIVGAATMYKMQKAYPTKSILLIEKEKELADHQTGNNSGVIHSGIYYKPGSKKAVNCVNGRRELVAFAKEYGIQHDVCGKLIVAVDESELPFLNKIEEHGVANGIEDMRRVTAEEIKEIEPHCIGIDGLFIGCTGIIDFRGATKKMVELALSMNSNSELHLKEEVIRFNHTAESTEVITDQGTYSATHLIVCGGLQADRLARKDGVQLKEKVVGFRGDYYELTEQAKHKVRNLIYPVPNPDFPFLGVHFTRMVDGSVECGPNAVFTFKREGYGKTDFSLKDTWDSLT